MKITNKAGAFGTPSSNSDLSSYVDSDFSFGPESEEDSEPMDQNLPVMLDEMEPAQNLPVMLDEMEPAQNLPVQNVEAVQNVAYLPNDMWDTNSDYSTDSDEQHEVPAPDHIIFNPTKNKDYKDRAGKLKKKTYKKTYKKNRKTYKKSYKKTYKKSRKFYKKTRKLRFRK
jgi:hypothetical protein